MNQTMLKPKEVADMLGVSVYTVHRLKFKPDGLRAYKVAGAVRFKPEDVEAYLEAQKVKPVVKAEAMPDIRRFTYVPGMRVV